VAGEVTQLGNAGLPTGFFAILDKSEQSVDKAAADTLLVTLTEADNKAPLEIEVVDYDTAAIAETTQLTRVLPFSFDTLTPNFADVATPPIITGTFPLARTDTLTVGFTDSSVLVQITDPEKSATDTLTVVLTESDATIVELGVEIVGEDELIPVIDDVFQIVQLAPFQALESADALGPVLTERAILDQTSSDVDAIQITGGPVGFITVTPR